MPQIHAYEGITYNPEMNFTIAFIGFDLSSAIDAETQLPETYNHILQYSMNYEFIAGNTTYTQDFNAYIDEIATQSWTSDLNTSALEEQKVNFTKKSIFTQKNGTAIDGLLIEKYLMNNPVSGLLPNINHHIIYLLNLSRLDDGENDHWFNINETDPDANRPRSSWRLEWDYELGNNYNVRFPYPAFSRDSDISIIDLTAFQWYLEWRALWNVGVDIHESYYEDLDHLMTGETASEKQATFDDMTLVWLTDWIKNIYSINIVPVVGNNLTVQLLIIYSSFQINVSDISWVINDNQMQSAVSQLYQSDLDFLVRFVDLDSDLYLNSILEDSKVSYQNYQPGRPDPFEQWTYYDGSEQYYNLMDNTLNNYFEPLSGTQLKGTVFLLDNASYVGSTPWTGGLFTGLGGSLRLTILYELQRALFEDGSRKAGLSRVLVHEIGHALGIPHTFTNRFASDFLVDTMGYYPHSGNYSVLMKEQYQRYLSDEAFDSAINTYSNSQNLADNIIQNFLTKFEIAKQLHMSKQYQAAETTLRQAEQILLNTSLNTTTEVSTTPHLSIVSQSSNSISSNLTSSSSSIRSDIPSSIDQASLYFGILLVIPVWVRRKRKIA